MNIALVSCVYPPYKSGIGNVAARHARQLTDMGHRVTVYCPAHDDEPGRDIVDGIVVERLRAFVRHGNSALVPQLMRHMKGHDAAYIMWPFFGGAEWAALGARLTRTPYVVFFHMDVLWDGWRGRVLDVYERTVEPWVMRGAHAVLASSLEMAHAGSLGRVRGITIHPSPYSLDLSRFHPPAPDEVRPRVPSIVFVGAMDAGHAFKGVPQLITAFARVRAEMPCTLELVGDGDLRPGFEARAQASGAGDDIHFLGRVDDDELARTYRMGTVVVLPSTTREEAFGVVLAEGMASGCACIASDFPGVDAVVRSGGGILVPPGDVAALAAALTSVVGDPARHAGMSATALDSVARYQPDAEQQRLARAFAGIPKNANAL
jgi:glycosyltransferase involved in cell wall biosynthesis